MNELSWIGSLWLALANIVGPFFSFFAARIGYKWMLVAAVFCCSLSLILASFANEIWQLYLTQGVLSGIGASLVWFPCISAPQQWFSKRRGLAVGIAISGSGFGGLVFSNVANAAIENLGYQWALRIVGLISFVLVAVAAFLVRPLNKPSVQSTNVFNLRPFKNIQFVLLFTVQLLGNFAFNVPSGFLPSFATDVLHAGSWVSSNMPAILSGVMIVGKIGSGFVGDYIGRVNMQFICTTMTGLMCLTLWLTASNVAAVWAFAALFGLFGGGYLSISPAVLAQVVGLEDIESANGLLFFAWFFGGLFGSPICSALINNGAEKTYNYAIIFGGVIMVFGGLLVWVVRVMRVGWNPLRKA
ncbi:major facilitator superfamily domain-containing protein [Radiomyces spectabilis]|uniref:major facilitator superfamily domain-containing protein n=1 Tax=Radiomyces spectabilis TaxID=64574 RepID=UPI00222022CA|nr:major facilitator superfamily domain-containing protein [Radiomyces spectabilis]KAI8379355.1 major facilitator superfamily domain-containing protein [Radiomyces spectabilis]